jgi:hypothetical protein
MKKAKLLNKIDPAVWKQQWVIDSQAVGQGENSLLYISGSVSGLPSPIIVSKALRMMSLISVQRPLKEKVENNGTFCHGISQKIPATCSSKGFMKIRHYG